MPLVEDGLRQTPGLAIFDLDKTVLSGDSDSLFRAWLVEVGLAGSAFAARGQDFASSYARGTFNPAAYLSYLLTPISGIRTDTLIPDIDAFVRERVLPLVRHPLLGLISTHRHAGHQVLLATSTVDLVARPVATALNVDGLVASEAEVDGDRFTGSFVGVPAFGQGKLDRVRTWIRQENSRPSRTWFYSDSANDLPLLNQVDFAVAVCPSASLRLRANQASWAIFDFNKSCAAPDATAGFVS